MFFIEKIICDRKVLLYKTKKSNLAIKHYNTIIDKKVIFPKRFFRKKNILERDMAYLVMREDDNVLFKKILKIEEKFVFRKKRMEFPEIKEVLAKNKHYFHAVYWIGCYCIIYNFTKTETITCKNQDDAKRLHWKLSEELDGNFLFLGKLRDRTLIERLKRAKKSLYRKNSR